MGIISGGVLGFYLATNMIMDEIMRSNNFGDDKENREFVGGGIALKDQQVPDFK